MRRLVPFLASTFLFVGVATAQEAGNPHAIEPPAWFAQSFLEFREEAADAAKAGKRLLLYFGQDGCPYCKELLQNNFSQPDVVAKTRRHFVAVALNIWGDRETTWLDGKSRSEKELARFLKVQFTPTVLLLDEKGGTVARINGYYPPARFAAALDYAAQRLEGRRSFAEHMQAVPGAGAAGHLHDESFFLKPPLDLRRVPGGKPLAVLFETRHCAACDELHREGFRRPDVQAALDRFDVARIALGSRETITTPAGRHLAGGDWARELGIGYTPSVVFFDAGGQESFRVEAYVRPFHFASSFEYVAAGGPSAEPEFQRWLQHKAEHLKGRGGKLELWK